MKLFIRLARIFSGLVAAWQIIGLLPVATWIINKNQITGHMWVVLGIKTVVFFIFGGLYYWLGRVNRINPDFVATQPSIVENSGVSDNRVIVRILLSLAGIGILLAIGLPAYKDYKNRADSPKSNTQKSSDSKSYGLGIQSRESYEATVSDYRKKIQSGEVHLFEAAPTIFLREGDKEWPTEEVKKIGFLWWYEGDYIYMMFNNHHPRISMRRVMLGMNHGACGSIAQTLYTVDLNVDVKPAHYAVARISNESLFKFAYQINDKLNEEEQKRWATGRKYMTDCVDVVNAWIPSF